MDTNSITVDSKSLQVVDYGQLVLLIYSAHFSIENESGFQRENSTGTVYLCSQLHIYFTSSTLIFVDGP